MTREDVIRMAREQGDFIDDKGGGAFIFNCNPEHTFNIFKFAALVAAAEREECAKLVDEEMADYRYGTPPNIALNNAAAAIRARSK